MEPLWLAYATYAIAAAMGVAWLFAAWNIVIVSRELARARRAGEATFIPKTGRGLPLGVIFTKDVLPRVETQRHRLVVAILFFLAGLVALPLLHGLFGAAQR